MTLSKLRDIFGVEYQEIVHKSLPSAYIEELLNEGARTIARRTRCLDSVYTTNSVIDQGTYGLDTEMQYGGIFKVEYAGEELDYQSSPTSDTSSGTPAAYYMLEGTLGLWPIPTAVAEIKVHAYEVPDDMTADGDTSSLPIEYHRLMVDFALHKAFKRMGNIDMSRTHESEYERGILEMESRSSRQVHQGGVIKNLTTQVFR